MELIVIDRDRMKIMLSSEELSSYKIDASALDTEDEATKRKLYDIVDRAKRTAGFEWESTRMFVQVFASLDGGCEMYVTRYSQLYDEEVECMSQENSNEQKPSTPVRKRRLIYRFASVSDMLRACKALAMRGYSEPSEAYISEDGEMMYLVLYDGGADISVVLEYAEPVFFGGWALYIGEHASVLCERCAVESLGALC